MDATEQAPVLQEHSGTKLSNEFPASLRILVVDTDLNSLLSMENLMKNYFYKVTTSQNAEEAVSILRAGRVDIVIWDLHMPGMEGLEVLKTIGSEMDLPVIIMSSDHETEVVMKCIIYGACDYLVKPVSKDTIAIIWQHVVRKKRNRLNHLVRPEIALNVDVGQENDPTKVNCDRIYQTGHEAKGLKKGDDGENEAAGFREVSPAAKKQRMNWTDDLHRKFVDAVNKIGIDKAVPKQILKCMEDMKVEGLTRNNVASHLQKYRLSLQRNCRFPQENPDFRRFAVSNTPTFKPSSLFEESNIQARLSSIEALFNEQTANPIAPELANRYIPVNNPFVINPLMHFPYRDERSLQLPPLTTEESARVTMDGTNPELIYDNPSLAKQFDHSEFLRGPFG